MTLDTLGDFLTFDEQEALDEVTKYFLDNPPMSDDELHYCIELMLGVRIPRKAVCQDHDPPFQFVADLFFERISKALVLANRSGGKTYNVGALNTCESIFKDGCGIISIGGSEQQANKQYQYTQEFFGRSKLLGEMLVDSLIHKTALSNGSHFKILASSEKAVHHDHVPKLRLDELELIEPNIYKGAISIPQSDTARNIRQSVLATSTRFKAHGMMQTLLDEAEKRGYKVYKWCYKEIAEKCSDDRSGMAPTVYWVNRKKKSVLTQVQYDSMASGEGIRRKAGYSKRDMFNRCVNCILAPSCQGDLKRSEGHYLIDDLIDKYIEDLSVWDSEWECRRPYSGELTYEDWDTEMHATKVPFLPELEAHCAMDFGYNCPFYACWFQVEPLGRVRVFKELWERKKLVKWLGPKLNETARKLGVKVTYYGDIAGKRKNEISGTSPIGELRRKHGIHVKAKKIYIVNRIDVLRSRLVDAEGNPGVIVDYQNCPHMVEAFETNRVPSIDELSGKESDEKPIKDNREHPLDALGTGLAHVFHRTTMTGY